MRGVTIYYEGIVLYCNMYAEKLLYSDTVSVSLTPMWDMNRISYSLFGSMILICEGQGRLYFVTLKLFNHK